MKEGSYTLFWDAWVAVKFACGLRLFLEGIQNKRNSGLENVCTNYRPILVLSPLNKIFEKLLYDR